MLNPVHLRTLQAVIDAGSFALAARDLGYTASAVSQQMSALERLTGLVLFERAPRSVHPTSAALTLGRRAEGLLHEITAIEREAHDIADARRGEMVVAGFPTANARILPQALARLTARTPEVRLLLDEGEPWDTVPRILEGIVDVALLYEYDHVPRELPAGLSSAPLLAERFFILLPRGHARAGDPQVNLGDLRADAWATTRVGTAGAIFLERAAANEGFEPRVSFRSNDYAVIRGLVGAGHGVAIVPELAVVPGPGLHALPVAGMSARRRVFAAFRPEAYQPLRPAFLACLTETCETMHRY